MRAAFTQNPKNPWVEIGGSELASQYMTECHQSMYPRQLPGMVQFQTGNALVAREGGLPQSVQLAMIEEGL